MTFSFCSFFSEVQKTQATIIMVYQSFEKTVIVQLKQCSHMNFFMFNSCLIEAGLKSRWYENGSFTFSDQFPCFCTALGFSVDWYACVFVCMCCVTMWIWSQTSGNLQQTVFFPLHFVNDWWITPFRATHQKHSWRFIAWLHCENMTNKQRKEQAMLPLEIHFISSHNALQRQHSSCFGPRICDN